MQRKFMCNRCMDLGYVYRWFKKRTCPTCNGLPSSQLPPRPKFMSPTPPPTHEQRMREREVVALERIAERR